MFSAFLLLLALVSHSGAHEGAVYDQQSTNLSNVFNATTRWFSFQDKRTANLAASSEFAGAFQWCSNEKLHCISGPLNVVIPKAFAQGAWEQAGIRCSTRIVGPATLIGECTSAGVATSYVFERERGIVSYRLVADTEPYVLRGARGLFSSH